MLTRYRPELLLAVGIFVFNLLFLGHVGVFNVDEAIYTEATREMIENGDLITPYYNYEYRWKKPPLTYWAMYLPELVFGPTAAGARLSSACQGALCALLLALFGRAVFGGVAGLWAGAVFGTCFHGYIMGRGAVTDMTLVFWLTGGWLGLFLADERRSPRWGIVAGACIGMAVLTKGPLAIILTGGTWLVYLLARRRLWANIVETRFWWCLLALVLVAAPWYIAIYQLHGMAFYNEFLGYHNVARFSKALEGHGGPIVYYVPIVLGGLAPWTGFAVAGMVSAWRRRAEDSTAARAGLWLLLWFWLTMALFSVAGTKLLNYIAPLYPAGALLAGHYVAGLLGGQETLSRRGWWAVGVFNVGTMLVLGIGLLSAPLWTSALPVLRNELGIETMPMGPGPIIAGAVLLAGALLMLAWWRQGVSRALLCRLGGFGVVSCLCMWLGFMPVIYHYSEGTLRAMALEANRIAGPDGELAALNLHWPSLTLTTERRVTYFPGTQDTPEQAAQLPQRLAERFAQPKPIVMMVRKIREKDLLRDVPHHVWADRLGYKMISNLAPPAGYELPPSPWTERQFYALKAASR